MPFIKTVHEPVVTYSTKQIESVKITGAKTAHEFLTNAYKSLPDHVECEYFIILALNRANEVIGTINLAKGGTAGVIVDPKIAIRKLINHIGVSGCILSHNHPSGKVQPSQADIKITEKMKGACKYFDISVLDHIIYSDGNKYYSFADEGMVM